ncbi:FtsX-like permease family protein [Dactylosporangium matsuzakiense]|uniref:ABC3 transporter permease C-terminal domain-containing protein n=1 Tax=Dactylosporangium matsuzakiense TaxID=53360 RepID=A0A9W6KUE7_9ACTN|nr:FtsX-like permease family protein [Dactylosporangium matsuzakiense]UWZ43831.1 FtsX-like permease family protein [Dactylosporangium matsuzakiense]GLL07853.1 hypothetical protein GCM10017581_096120 [Dactylosporangium matsuzakiense]
MNASLAIAWRGARRRPLASLAVGLSTAAAVTAAVLGAGLLIASDGPFDRAFAAQRGAHLTVEVDPGRAEAARVAATARVTGIAAAAGPFATVSVTPSGGAGTGWMEGKEMSALRVAGRGNPDAVVDRVTVVTGRWVSGPGQIVLAADPPPPPLGSTVVFADRPGRPALTVVGTARSAGHSADAWVVPEQIAGLAAPGAPAGWQMLYRLDQPETAAEVDSARAAVAAALPPGAVRGSQSWLTVRAAVTGGVALYVPFLLAFGGLSLALSGFVAASTIAGTVSTDRRRIGVLKAVGCGPAQVMWIYLARVLLPAAAGALLGLIAGNVLAVPILAETADVYGAAGADLPAWTTAAATAAVLAVVAAAAATSARRAARLPAAEILATGPARTTPKPSGPRRIASRALAIAATVAFSAVTVTLAAGLTASLAAVQEARPRGGDVLVTVAVDRDAGQDADQEAEAVVRAIDAQPGTQTRYGLAASRPRCGPRRWCCSAGPGCSSRSSARCRPRCGPRGCGWPSRYARAERLVTIVDSVWTVVR